MQTTHDSDCEWRLGHDCTCAKPDPKDAEIARLTRERDEAVVDAEFFIGEVKLRNRIPSTNDTAASLQKQVEALTAEIARLTRERDEALAKVAAAFEAAKDAIVSALDMSGAQMAGRYDQNKFDFHAVNTLTPADATAALARIKAQERAAGMREAAKIVADKRVIFGTDEYAVDQPWTTIGKRIACGICETAILARADAVERGDP